MPPERGNAEQNSCVFADTGYPGTDEADAERVRLSLRGIGRSRPFRRGDRLLALADVSDEVLLVESGVVRVVLSSDGGDEVIAGLYGEGEILGELGVLSGVPRMATVVAHTEGVAVHVPRTRFLAFVLDDRLALLHMVGTLQRRLRKAERNRLDTASLDVPTRVARELLDLARSCGWASDEGVVVSGLSQRELAQLVSAHDKTVEAALRLLRSAGLLRTARRLFVLPDPDRLESSLASSGWRIAGPPGR